MTASFDNDMNRPKTNDTSNFSDAILDRLGKLHPKLIDLSLDRVHRLLAALGHPEKQVPPVVHIAGTNGKGSTLSYLRSMAEAAGLKVHAYISPHLVRFHERIYVAGQDISEPDLVTVLEECERVNDGAPITYFEITTVAAFLAFSRTPADLLLLEVGLGGRLDTTNVIDAPAVSVITPIGLDHQQFLGDTVDLIAGEKAGILKANCPAVIGPQEDSVREVLERTCDRLGVTPLFAGQDFQAYEEHGRLVYQDDFGLQDLPLPRLTGRHQIDNAGTALAVLAALPTELSERIDDDARAKGLRTVQWPARLQRLKTGPLFDLLPEGTELWLDGGHNPAAGTALAQSLAEMNDRDGKPLHMIMGMLETKDAAGYLRPFDGLVRSLRTLTIPEEPGSASAQSLVDAAVRAGLTAQAAANLAHALQDITAITAGTPARILICGSLYLAGQVLRENG